MAAGLGTRLYPATKAISKPLLPVYDKPMIYYPLSVLLQIGIRDILIITAVKELGRYEDLLGDGSQLGVRISYAIQAKQEGIAQAFGIGEEFIAGDHVCLILGDNIFYGHGLSEKLASAAARKQGATVFAYWVNGPERYGVVTFDESGQAMEIEEKPARPKSNWAVTGLYFYDNRVLDIAAGLKPSARGELEITDVNRVYLEMDSLFVKQLGRGIAWLDTGTHQSLMQASSFIEAIEQRQGLKVACIDEIAYRMGYINAEQLKRLAKPFTKNGYGQYLLSILKHGRPN